MLFRSGIIVVSVDGDTSTFLAAVTGKESITAYLDLYGYDAGGSEVVSIRALPVRARMSIDPASGTPLDPAALYYTKTEIDALLTGYPTLAGDNAFTGANTFTNSAGIVTQQAATQDAMRLIGRAAGTGSHVLSLTPTTLTNSRTATLPDASIVVAGSASALTEGYMTTVAAGGLLASTDISVGAADGFISRAGLMKFTASAAGSITFQTSSGSVDFTPNGVQSVSLLTSGEMQLMQEVASYPAANAYPLIYRTGATGTGVFSEAGNLVLQARTSAARSIVFAGATSEWARISATGQFLIGTATAGASKLVVNDDSIQINTAKTPASASATGTLGQVAWDSSYIYVCTTTNTWVRAALTTW